jgi:hypothetical protein
MVGKKIDYRVEALEAEPIYLTEIVSTQTETIEKTSGPIGSFVIRRQKCVRIRIRARSVSRPRQIAPRNRRW